MIGPDDETSPLQHEPKLADGRINGHQFSVEYLDSVSLNLLEHDDDGILHQGRSGYKRACNIRACNKRACNKRAYYKRACNKRA